MLLPATKNSVTDSEGVIQARDVAGDIIVNNGTMISGSINDASQASMLLHEKDYIEAFRAVTDALAKCEQYDQLIELQKITYFIQFLRSENARIEESQKRLKHNIGKQASVLKLIQSALSEVHNEE